VLGQRAARDPADPVAGDVLIATTGSAAPPMRFGFDAQGFVGSVTSPLGRRWTIESGVDGQPRRLTSPSGNRLTYVYGADGQVERVRRGVPGTERTLFAYTHDATGRVTRTTYADGTRATTAYLPAGDLGVLDPGGTRRTEVVDRLGRTTRYAYDADGDLTAITDALGRTTRFAYAEWRRPVAMTFADGWRERYAYDGAGHVAGITGADGVVLRVRCGSGTTPPVARWSGSTTTGSGPRARGGTRTMRAGRWSGRGGAGRTGRSARWRSRTTRSGGGCGSWP